MKCKATFVLLIVVFVQVSVKAIDPGFSQFFLYSPSFNPAVVGSINEPRMFLYYRNQLPEFGSTFVTYQGSYDQYIKSVHGGVGVNICRDIVGSAYSATNFDL